MSSIPRGDIEAVACKLLEHRVVNCQADHLPIRASGHRGRTKHIECFCRTHAEGSTNAEPINGQTIFWLYG
jgi:hypothetical protein